MSTNYFLLKEIEDDQIIDISIIKKKIILPSDDLTYKLIYIIN